MKLNRLHQSRWRAATRLFNSMCAAAIREGADLMLDHQIVPVSAIEIDYGIGTIRVRIDDRCTIQFFQADPDFDHGLYETIGAFEKHVRERFRLVKTIPW